MNLPFLEGDLKPLHQCAEKSVIWEAAQLTPHIEFNMVSDSSGMGWHLILDDKGVKSIEQFFN